MRELCSDESEENNELSEDAATDDTEATADGSYELFSIRRY